MSFQAASLQPRKLQPSNHNNNENPSTYWALTGTKVQFLVLYLPSCKHHNQRGKTKGWRLKVTQAKTTYLRNRELKPHPFSLSLSPCMCVSVCLWTQGRGIHVWARAKSKSGKSQLSFFWGWRIFLSPPPPLPLPFSISLREGLSLVQNSSNILSWLTSELRGLSVCLSLLVYMDSKNLGFCFLWGKHYWLNQLPSQS